MYTYICNYILIHSFNTSWYILIIELLLIIMFLFCFIPYCSIVLLLAYMKGNANLCRAIVRAGARLGVNNNQGVNIFNYQVATKQLLFRLLGTRTTDLTF